MSVSRRANIRASCYVVDAVTTSLSGLHYSTTGAGGKSCYTIYPALLTDTWC